METTASFNIAPYLYYKVCLMHLNSSYSPSLLHHPSPAYTPKEGISSNCMRACVSIAKEVLDSIMNMQHIICQDVCLCL